MFAYQGKTALVTGASTGIGAEFVRELASRGMNVILVARNEAAMNTLTAELSSRYQTAFHVIPADLSREDAVSHVVAAVTAKNLQVDLLINNAGFMTHGPFETIPAATEQAEVMVNVASLVGMTHAFLPGMLERQQGGVINVASIAGFQPIPYLAVYAATKAFVISFSVALWEECRSRNVVVLGLCPGTTKTELFDRASAAEAAVGKPRTVRNVVASGLKALERRRSLVVDGWQNMLLTHGPRLIPRWFAARCAGQAVRPKTLSR